MRSMGTRRKSGLDWPLDGDGKYLDDRAVVNVDGGIGDAGDWAANSRGDARVPMVEIWIWSECKGSRELWELGQNQQKVRLGEVSNEGRCRQSLRR